MPDLQSLVDAFRSDIDEDVASFFSDAEAVRWINRGKGYIWAKAVEADEDFGLTSFDFSIVADTANYVLQNDVYRIRRIEQIFPSDSSRVPIPWYPIDLNQKGDYDASAGGGSEAPLRYFLEARQFRTVPVPNSAQAGTNNGRVWYIPKLGDLQSGTATAGGASTITFPTTNTLPGALTSRIDDYYNGLDILITSGTGVGQVRRITDYDGSTRVATVDVPWTTLPTSASLYSLMTPIPDEYQYLQSQYAVIRGYLKDEADEKRVSKDHAILLNEFIQYVTARQNQKPRYVNYETDERYIG